MLTTLFQHFYLYAPILTDHPIPAFYIFKYLKYSELNQIPKKYISIIVWWSAIPVLGGQ
jgi:transposase